MTAGKLRRALVVVGLVAVVIGVPSPVPAEAATVDVIDCAGALTTYSRHTEFSTGGTGTAVCTIVGTSATTAGILNVQLSTGGPTCQFGGALLQVTIGGHFYWFSYFGAGANNTAQAVQLSATRDGSLGTNVTGLSPWGGDITWVDPYGVTATVCVDQPTVPIAPAGPIAFRARGVFIEV
jgi:hypothetical protein